ncbi:MAG: YidC/Oxa1 family insertase periplasmic-domain containing protein [Bdellovibrionota bacterium]
MKRNWILISTILVLIVSYEVFVLGPYNKKYAPKPKVEKTLETTSSASSEATMSVTPGAIPAQAEKSLGLSAPNKGTAEKIEINDTRYFSVYETGAIGDAVFTKYFKRGTALKEPIRIADKGLHWTSNNPKVQACFSSFKQLSKLNFVGEAEGVKCSLTYQSEKLLLAATLGIESNSEINGEVFFETEDGLGEGPQFDHKHLTLKKKDEKVSHIKEKALWEEPVKSTGPFDFISWGDKYFATTLLPKGRFNPSLFYKEGLSEQRVHWGLSYPIRWSPEEKKISYDLDVYFSLKELKEVTSVREDLADTIDFGFFGSIARFMLWMLEALYKIFHNYGVAIIILSLAIRMLLWPVNKKMFESGRKMKEIQPQMEAIKKKYEGNKDQMMQMNNEIRQLYSKSGVNPLGSCLPVVLQIPIFFGLNSALSNSVNLYQAPFFGWITDLSYKDPLYILPVVWTLSLIASVELNPQPTASQPGMPDMKWISRVMFVVFGFVSKDFPSGLNIYFLVSNLAGMWQQWLFKKKNQVASQNILLGKER